MQSLCYHLLLADAKLSAHPTCSHLHVSHWLTHVQWFSTQTMHGFVGVNLIWLNYIMLNYLAQSDSFFTVNIPLFNICSYASRDEQGHHLTAVTAWFNRPACGEACVARLTTHANANSHGKWFLMCVCVCVCILICTLPTLMDGWLWRGIDISQLFFNHLNENMNLDLVSFPCIKSSAPLFWYVCDIFLHLCHVQ